ncbi:hypothetical protein BDY19DRAFT_909418 [Irpex rosettiformis]|uniref:Uncharacterized protein n=1 Tax=Irpex rosettiformis TaxID=378272 RepID=A0ACB8TSI0_9APHY|nr:hypothetical protein BDY19DRAFT_909418 [Irpex rosettiformis]
MTNCHVPLALQAPVATTGSPMVPIWVAYNPEDPVNDHFFFRSSLHFSDKIRPGPVLFRLFTEHGLKFTTVDVPRDTLPENYFDEANFDVSFLGRGNSSGWTENKVTQVVNEFGVCVEAGFIEDGASDNEIRKVVEEKVATVFTGRRFLDRVFGTRRRMQRWAKELRN